MIMKHNFSFFNKQKKSELEQRYLDQLGWSKTPVSSQTDKLMAGTKFSGYLGIKYYKKKQKKLKISNFLCIF